MSTQQTATVYITNGTDGNASIQLFHQSSSSGMQSGIWQAAPGATVGPLTVNFETGIGAFGILDYWCVILRVTDGSAPGTYISNTGGATDPQWFKECQLESKDAGQTLTFSVNTTTFNINEDSGACVGSMSLLYAQSSPTPITNVFVVMLENHSFDNILAMSGIPGITAATTNNSNSYTDANNNTTKYYVADGAPTAMPTDPGHEFPDTLEQLGGVGATYPSGGPYPTVQSSGFAANYATTTTEGSPPSSSEIGDIMACFDTPNQLPVIQQLASQFGVCDQWFSSLPGPTWPNRFFLHGASSVGIDYSPSTEQIITWEVPLEGFTYPNGSIYDRLSAAGIPYRFYADTADQFSDDPQNGSELGAIPQVTSLHGVTILDINSLADLPSDLNSPYPYAYTFIEPNYGDVSSTYEGGSSMHPMDDTAGAEGLLSYVYNAIRSSPIWQNSLLIITFDEHGGFYDSVAPGSVTAPNDGSGNGTSYGFDFTQYGVRVPTIVVSPYISAGTVDHTVYDHTSVLATLEKMLGLAPMTDRDAQANYLANVFTTSELRTDCPEKLTGPTPATKSKRAQRTPEEDAKWMAKPLPKSGNLGGFLHTMAKAEYELLGKTQHAKTSVVANVKALKTRGDARDYIRRVQSMIAAERAARK